MAKSYTSASISEPTPPPPVERPLGVTLVALLFLLEGMILEGVMVFGAVLGTGSPSPAGLIAGAGMGLLLALPFIAVSVGLFAVKKWAKWAAITLCGLVLLSIPGWNLLLFMAVAPFQLFAGSYLVINKHAQDAFDPPPPEIEE